MAEKKSKKKSKLKEFIGPVAVTPNLRKQEKEVLLLVVVY